MLRSEDFIKSQLVLTAWRYGREYGGHIPSTMIMHCIANRVKAGWALYLDTLEKIPVYSYLNAGEEPTGFPQVWEPAFTKLLHAVDGVYDGSAPDPTDGALYWADLNKISREWFLTNVVRSPYHPRVADCNSLTFFK